MSFVFAPKPPAGLPIVGSGDLFPVRRVYCLGFNYAEHAREWGDDPDREPPCFFCKANDSDSIVLAAYDRELALPYPPQTQNFHYEVELVAAIGRKGADIPAGRALEHVFGYAVGLDMTRRDLQLKMSKIGRPWEIGKAFDHSAPIGPLHRASEVGHFTKAKIWLDVNGARKQNSDIANMVWPVGETVAYLSRLCCLEPGDLIFTGTPAGVGPVVPGDVMKPGIECLGELTVRVTH